MKVLVWVGVLVMVMGALLLVAGQLGFLTGTMPTDLGMQNGRLKPPSATPNSVSSQADLYPNHPQRSYASIAPLAFQGDADVAMQKLATVVRNLDGSTLLTQQADYLYAQCSTPILRFTDDVEFMLDRKAMVIHVRSASRLGQGDLGANRARVEAIRAQFQKN